MHAHRHDRHGPGRSAAVGAGISAAVFFAFAPLPLQVAVAADMGLTAGAASRWILAVWATGAVASIVLSVRHRQPIVITWSVAGLLYLGSVAGDHTFAELVGANLVAGIAILILALLGVGERVMRLVPAPIVLAMFAGSVFEYVTGAFAAAAGDILVAGTALVAYFGVRALGMRRIHPLAFAAFAGTGAAVLAGRTEPLTGAFAAPSVGLPGISFSLDAILTVSPALVVFALALGNVQGLGYLSAQGYRVPVNAVSVAVGLASIVNAVLGGHQASVARATSAIVASPEAGPAEGRHVASVVAAAGALVIAAGAATVVALVGALPASLVAVVTGLAVLPSFQDSLERSLTASLRAGPLVAFLVAATPFEMAGVSSSSWALLAGAAVSLATEREALAQTQGASRSSSGRTPLSSAFRRARSRSVPASSSSPAAPPAPSASASSQALRASSGG
jgi:benzoate membrane transport protein